MDPCFWVTALLQTRHERDVGGQDFYLAEGGHIRPGSETPEKKINHSLRNPCKMLLSFSLSFIFNYPPTLGKTSSMSRFTI